MFAISDGYELYMGRWGRLLARSDAAFAGVKDGQRLLDVGTGTGAVALALEATLPRSEICKAAGVPKVTAHGCGACMGSISQWPPKSRFNPRRGYGTNHGPPIWASIEAVSG